jgi:very-short-patch-repair endonuclease
VRGASIHSDAKQFAADRRRDAALVGMGYLVLRFTWLDAVTRPAHVIAMVRAALAVHA